MKKFIFLTKVNVIPIIIDEIILYQVYENIELTHKNANKKSIITIIQLITVSLIFSLKNELKINWPKKNKVIISENNMSNGIIANIYFFIRKILKTIDKSIEIIYIYI